jgi:1,4-dihydroxy-2-naphthoate octaprenyltransferase
MGPGSAVRLVWFYTAPPLRLNYRALGEVGCALVLNVIWPLLAYRLQAPGVPGALLALAALLFVMQTARMAVMNLADHDSDLAAGKRTLANALGQGRTVWLYTGLQAAGYAAAAGLTAVGVIPPLPGILVLATSALSARTVLILRRTSPGDAARMGWAAWLASTQISAAVYAAALGLLIASAAQATAALAVMTATVVALALFTILFALSQICILRQVRP